MFKKAMKRQFMDLQIANSCINRSLASVMMEEKQVKTIRLAKINKTDGSSQGNNVDKRAFIKQLEGEYIGATL